MKKVITVGVFDYFHLGHLRLFENAKKLGDYLIVAVQDGDSILKTKPDAKVLYTTEQRIDLVKALRVVDEVIVYQDVDRTLPEVDFDVFAILVHRLDIDIAQDKSFFDFIAVAIGKIKDAEIFEIVGN